MLKDYFVVLRFWHASGNNSIVNALKCRGLNPAGAVETAQSVFLPRSVSN
ncbi:Hypothetical protein EAG7_03835 [Klebsiella aerogenes]|nr:Hypothetical protein EAG7_03835 [Klebsiella aerogenes]CCG32333.1 hypothetical protein [Klebsiella aerogenes EA1509E]